MKQMNQKRRLVKPSAKCLPMLFCFLCIVLMSGSHASSQTQTIPPPVPAPQQESAPSIEPAPAEAPVIPPGSAGRPEAKKSSAMSEKVKDSLLKENFAYAPTEMTDPFTPFVTPGEVVPQVREADTDEGELAPDQIRPLTPLQKMTIAEIERGLKAITWGDLGRRAVIEDGAGKGYIVSVGTPAGVMGGVVSEIFNDRLVIQQEVWDREAKRLVPQNTVLKLKKDVKEKQ
jgi:Tfp pilus assembly protein PilP